MERSCGERDSRAPGGLPPGRCPAQHTREWTRATDVSQRSLTHCLLCAGVGVGGCSGPALLIQSPGVTRKAHQSNAS